MVVAVGGQTQHPGVSRHVARSVDLTDMHSPSCVQPTAPWVVPVAERLDSVSSPTVSPCPLVEVCNRHAPALNYFKLKINRTLGSTYGQGTS